MQDKHLDIGHVEKTKCIVYIRNVEDVAGIGDLGNEVNVTDVGDVIGIRSFTYIVGTVALMPNAYDYRH